VRAIAEHDSTSPFCGPGDTFDFLGVACVSEGSQSARAFQALNATDKQAVLDFLRAL
jgi:hypothetical protein